MQDYKYVWLAANSTFKADSDLAKYEKARKLKVRSLCVTHLPSQDKCIFWSPCVPPSDFPARAYASKAGPWSKAL